MSETLLTATPQGTNLWDSTFNDFPAPQATQAVLSPIPALTVSAANAKDALAEVKAYIEANYTFTGVIVLNIGVA